jgi:hypothetical protein
MGTYNIEVIATKRNSSVTFTEMEQRARNYLRYFLLDESETEKRLLGIWMEIYTRHLNSQP